MRVFMRINIPVEAGNDAIRDGSLARLIEAFLDKAKPQSAHFGVEDGERTMFVVFDLTSPADIPSLCEPLFQGLDARIHFQPVMDLADLQSGLAQLA